MAGDHGGSGRDGGLSRAAAEPLSDVVASLAKRFDPPPPLLVDRCRQLFSMLGSAGPTSPSARDERPAAGGPPDFR